MLSPRESSGRSRGFPCILAQASKCTVQDQETGQRRQDRYVQDAERQIPDKVQAEKQRRHQYYKDQQTGQGRGNGGFYKQKSTKATPTT